MNIAEAARRAGLTPKAIRFYEAQGLLRPRRASNGYRAFADPDVHTLRFLRRARDLGFSVEECRELLALYHDGERAPDHVRALAEDRVHDLDRRLAELQSIRQALARLACWQEGEPLPDFPLLDDGDGEFEEPRRRRAVGSAPSP
ncbi:MAG TPA: MerR family DNA-binding protein [Hyphomicrobiales bacterium]|nr:MerR family DNA-binding protein [Hyphomicrobiales bacterium]